MRLWSLHPRYLDTKGLLALWREGLLAQKVLAGRTKGYRNHPQLLRFKEQKDPLGSISNYLLEVWKEADRRNYAFVKKKVRTTRDKAWKIAVPSGQLRYEWAHLRKKLEQRDPGLFKTMKRSPRIEPHPSFRVVPGKVAKWEKI